jgi:hypothetical protein
MGIERHDEVPLIDKVPESDIDRILSDHPSHIQVPPLERSRRGRLREEEKEFPAVSKKVRPYIPQCGLYIAAVKVLDHPADTADIRW